MSGLISFFGESVIGVYTIIIGADSYGWSAAIICMNIKIIIS